jgi:outer membrane protein OmpA-like peptidoglycan-associated protein
MSIHRNFGLNNLGLSTLILGGAMGATALAQAQQTPAATPPAAGTTAADQAQPMSPDNNSTYATGKPLDTQQSKEGFWGHVNPFARKKWVAREVDPIKDRENELDQLQAKNANDIRDVDSRAKAGIDKAMVAANTADSHAADAANRANAAQTTANTANANTTTLSGTVSNLDQYSEVASSEVKFAAGRTTLGTQGKADLDDVATKLTNEKGYIIEVQGFSKSGVQTSQAMADAVVRYLVTEHQVPLYRIYRTGMGKNAAAADDKTAMVNGVRVSIMHNSLATMNATSASNTMPTGQTSPQPGAAQ